jgi:Fe-S-cluster containining protein
MISPPPSHVCARCSALGGGCCRNEAGLSGPPLTPGDIERIAARSGQQPAAFVVERPVDAEELQAWRADDRALAATGKSGLLRSLALRGADCHFLGPIGCTLGEARPLACQRFPFVSLGRRLTARAPFRCLALEEAPGLDEALRVFGLRRTDVRRLERQLVEECGGS